MATLLTIGQAAAALIGLPRPASIMSGGDQNVRRLLACAQQEGEALARRWTWQALTYEHLFTATATTTQADGIPTDFGRMLPNTFFNRTSKRTVRGPLTAREWQGQMALSAAVLFDAFRIQRNALEMVPTPDAGAEYAYEYVTKNWCEDADGVGKDTWSADTDVPRLDAEAIKLGIVWRFLQSRGLEYAEAMRNYEIEIVNLTSRDGARRAVDLTGQRGLGIGPRYPTVPEGSWNV
jgi:hypothetical protein